MKRQFTPYAAKALSAFGGIEIEFDNTFERVYIRYYGKSNGRKHKIYYNADMSAYFMFCGRRERLDEYVRI